MPPTEFFLEGKRAMVIAGSRGIGKGVALAFADAGADVAVSGLTTTNAEKVAQEIKAMGRQSAAYGADATKGKPMEKLAEQVIREFGPLDVVVNCLGDHITAVVAKRPGREERVADEELWHTIIDVNMTEAFLGCHYFGPHLLERKQGTIINIMRRWLRRLDFDAEVAPVGLNAGPSARGAQVVEDSVRRMAAASRQPVVIVGHSRGGQHGRVAAVRAPEAS